jgi:hypothetical protein
LKNHTGNKIFLHNEKFSNFRANLQQTATSNKENNFFYISHNYFETHEVKIPASLSKEKAIFSKTTLKKIGGIFAVSQGHSFFFDYPDSAKDKK